MKANDLTSSTSAPAELTTPHRVVFSDWLAGTLGSSDALDGCDIPSFDLDRALRLCRAQFNDKPDETSHLYDDFLFQSIGRSSHLGNADLTGRGGESSGLQSAVLSSSASTSLSLIADNDDAEFHRQNEIFGQHPGFRVRKSKSLQSSSFEPLFETTGDAYSFDVGPPITSSFEPLFETTGDAYSFDVGPPITLSLSDTGDTFMHPPSSVPASALFLPMAGPLPASTRPTYKHAQLRVTGADTNKVVSNKRSSKDSNKPYCNIAKVYGIPCAGVFNGDKNHDRHMLTHLPASYRCSTCRTTYSREESLIRHWRSLKNIECLKDVLGSHYGDQVEARVATARKNQQDVKTNHLVLLAMLEEWKVAAGSRENMLDSFVVRTWWWPDNLMYGDKYKTTTGFVEAKPDDETRSAAEVLADHLGWERVKVIEKNAKAAAKAAAMVSKGISPFTVKDGPPKKRRRTQNIV